MKVLVDRSLLREILESRDNILGLSWRHARALKKLLDQPLPTPEAYVEIYNNRPIWTYNGYAGMGAGTYVNKETSVQKLLVDKSFIYELLEQQYAILGFKNSVTLKLSQIIEEDILTPYQYTVFYNSR